MSFLVALLEPFDRNMRVELGGCQRGVPQYFLYRAQVSPPVQQVRGSAVAQRMGSTRCRIPQRFERIGDDLPGLAGIDPLSAASKEQRLSRILGAQRRPGPAKPIVNRVHRRLPEGNGAFLVSLANDPKRPPVQVDVVDVQRHQLPHSNGSGIEQFEDEFVAIGERKLFRRGFALFAVRCLDARGIGLEDAFDLVVLQYVREPLIALG